MKAAVLHERGKSPRLEQVTVEEPRAGEVLVRLAASGICGTDVHGLHGRSNVGKDLPLILGHEGAGVVEAIGPGVTSLNRGDHVMISASAPCGYCVPCRSGRLQFCEDPAQGKSVNGLKADGGTRLSLDGKAVYPYVGIGSFAEYSLVRDVMAVKIPPHLPLDRMCFCSCSVKTGVGAVFNVAQVQPASTVAVIGCGGVGLNTIQASRISGASRIVAIDTSQAKLDLAANFGATDFILADADAARTNALLHEIIPGGVGYAFEVVGSAALVRLAASMTARGGKIVMVGGIPWESDVSVNAGLMFGGRMLVGTTGGEVIPTREFLRIISLYEQGVLRLDELVGATFPLDDIAEAMREAEKAAAPKIVINIDQRLL
jgi:S-(hydroxymethyl)glutathione dehydrogenase/alcohol dehydrogenase